MRFLLVIARIEDRVLDAAHGQKLRQNLGFFDRDRADQHRLTALASLLHRCGDGRELVVLVLVELVILIDALHRQIRRDGDDVYLRSEEHTSELQSLMRNSYAVLCLTTKKRITEYKNNTTSTSEPQIHLST